MTAEQGEPGRGVTPDMTVLDVVSKYRDAVEVFKAYDQAAGVCICCEALFERLDRLSEKYGIDLDRLLQDCNLAANPAQLEKP